MNWRVLGTKLTFQWQIGFLTEWQLYAQKLEGNNWTGEKLDKSKLDKMSGMVDFGSPGIYFGSLTCRRSTTRSTFRAYGGYPQRG